MDAIQRKQKLATEFIKITDAVGESMYDFVVTACAMIVAIIAVAIVARGVELLTTWGMFLIISIYTILLIIRILRRLDNHYTVDELGAMLEMINDKVERIERNV